MRGTTILDSHFLPAATMGVPYHVKFRAVGNTAPIKWQIGQGSNSRLYYLTGLSLNAQTGELSGTPKKAGSFLIAVIAQATDEQERAFALTINGSNGAMPFNAGPIMPSGALPNGVVLAPGEPPLTQQMTDQIGNFFDWLFEIRLNGAQRRQIRDSLIASWNKRDKDEMEGVLDILKSIQDMETFTEAQPSEVREKLLPEFLAHFRSEPNDPVSQMLLQAYASKYSVRIKSFVIPYTLTSGESFAGKITLTEPAPLGGFVVTLRAQARGGYLHYPATVMVPAGKDTAEFTGNFDMVPSPRSGQIVAEGGGSSIPANNSLRPKR